MAILSDRLVPDGCEVRVPLRQRPLPFLARLGPPTTSDFRSLSGAKRTLSKPPSMLVYERAHRRQAPCKLQTA
jgi:hypothetical protein